MDVSYDFADLGAWDYSVRSFDGSTFEVVAGIDSSLHIAPSFILRFFEVSYVDCPTTFSHAQIRLADEKEKKVISKRVAIDDDDRIYALRAETMGQVSAQIFFIVAERLAKIESEQIDEGEPGLTP